MTEDELKALSALRFDWAMTPDDVWTPFPEHVLELHSRVARNVLAGVGDAARNLTGSPLGLVIEGQRGSGKTHLLGWVREQVQRDGYFFLVSLSTGDAFWAGTVESILDGLWRNVDGRGTQLHLLLQRLGTKLGASRALNVALSGTAVSRRGLDSFVRGLSDVEGHLGGPELQDTARALVLYASADPQMRDIATHYFLSVDGEEEDAARAVWGIASLRTPQAIIRDLSRLMALTGETVIAIDQLDGLVARAFTAAVDGTAESGERAALIAQIADGLMTLRELTRRTLVVVACMPRSWQLIQQGGAVTSAKDRFRVARLQTIPSEDVGRILVGKRFAARFLEVGFVPPYPTWPIAPEAFQDAPDFTPRGLLQRIDAHVQSCLDAGEVRELHRLDESTEVIGTAPGRTTSDAQLLRLDARFQQLRIGADVSAVFAPKTEDSTYPVLLAAGLTAWIEERDGARLGYRIDPPPSAKPALHARLRRTLNEDVEEEAHWAFRGICDPSARAVQSRIRSAVTQSGIKRGDPTRSLFLLRNTYWPGGPVTGRLRDDLRDLGGKEKPVTDGDLRTFAALRVMLTELDPALRTWLVARQPATTTELFRGVLPEPGSELTVPPADPTPMPTSDDGEGASAPNPISDDDESESPPTRPIPVITLPPATASDGGSPSKIITDEPETAEAPELEPETAHPGVVQFGRVMDTEQPVLIELEALRKHTVIFAGSGSGKTVLIRRLVEEVALQGVSSIVLDPNNDLARLGDEWPSPPPNWAPDDPARAKRYLADTDVVVWTPRRESGRPLSFQPLPDFASVIDDADEFRMAVDVAFGALAPRARADGRTRKAQEEQAVLRESIQFFAHHGGGDLEDLIDLMTNLPPEASRIGSAVKMAANMAQTLNAAMINDPLFGGGGQAFDPAVLLTPPAGKRARVSVISFIGLQSDEQRQGFVSQLQMALFSWFKKNPSSAPLGALLVMDEAQTLAPSGAMTASTESTLILASQARKYGLGLMFATQAPRGLHNRVSGNAATQLYGFLNSQSQIQSAREIARAKGGEVPDIGRLSRGQFYVAAEGTSFAKMHTRMCLSYHGSPLNADEVIARARRSLEP